MYPILDQEKWGYINSKGVIVITPQFEAARDFSEGVAAVKESGKWAFIDIQGKYLFQPIYDELADLKDGLAMVTVFGEMAYVNALGEYIWTSSDFPFQKKSKLSVSDKISQIRKIYQLVNSNLGTYSTEEIDLFGRSTEGGEGHYYYSSDSNLKKAVIVFYGEMGKIETEYYFYNNEPKFVYERSTRYPEPFVLENATIYENRYYFYNWELIRWINPDGEYVSSGSKEFLQQGLEVFKDIDQVLNYFGEKNK